MIEISDQSRERGEIYPKHFSTQPTLRALKARCVFCCEFEFLTRFNKVLQFGDAVK